VKFPDFPLGGRWESVVKKSTSLGRSGNVNEEPKRLVFHSPYELTLDEKNRLLIPSDVRRKIVPERDGEAFYLVEGINDKLWLYPELYYDSLVEPEQNELMPDVDALAYDHWNLGSVERIAWDKAGRILIPEPLLQKAKLGKEVTLVGARDHLELWNRSEWNAYLEALRQRKSEIAVKRRLKPPTAM
jgi:MraZ protein